MLQVLRLKISYTAHCVPYLLKEPVLSVFLLNERYKKAFLSPGEILRPRLKNIKIGQTFDIHTD
jgi:hypothetical protein